MKLLQVIADFESSLDQAVGVGASGGVLTSGLDTNGLQIPDGLYGLTIDGDSENYKEFIVATVVFGEGATVLEGVQSVDDQGTLTEGFTKYHRRGALVTITDWASLSRITSVLTGENGIDPSVPLYYASTPTLGTQNQLATVGYVLDHVNGGAVSFSSEVIAGNSGEALTAGDWVYLKLSDGLWYKTDADDTAKSTGVRIGKALGTTSASGDSIGGGVFLNGLEITGSYVVNNTYYLSNTAGQVSTTPGTNSVTVGVADVNSKLVVSQATQATAITISTGMIIPYAGSSAPASYLLCDGSAVSRATYSDLFAVISTTYGVGDGSTTFNVPDSRSRAPVGAGTGTKVATFASRSTNVITVTGLTNAANNEFQTGQPVTYHTTGSVITGLTNNVVYYVVRTGNATFSLATTLANAQNAVVISLSSDGSGTQTFTLALTTRARGNTGGEENHAMSLTELLAHTHDQSLHDPGGVTSPADAGNSLIMGSGGSTGGNAAMNNMQPFFTINWIIKY